MKPPQTIMSSDAACPSPSTRRSRQSRSHYSKMPVLAAPYRPPTTCHLARTSGPLLLAGFWPPPSGRPLSRSYCPAATDRQRLAGCNWPPTLGRLVLAARYWPPTIGCPPLAGLPIAACHWPHTAGRRLRGEGRSVTTRADSHLSWRAAAEARPVPWGGWRERRKICQTLMLRMTRARLGAPRCTDSSQWPAHLDPPSPLRNHIASAAPGGPRARAWSPPRPAQPPTSPDCVSLNGGG